MYLTFKIIDPLILKIRALQKEVKSIKEKIIMGENAGDKAKFKENKNFQQKFLSSSKI